MFQFRHESLSHSSAIAASYEVSTLSSTRKRMMAKSKMRTRHLRTQVGYMRIQAIAEPEDKVEVRVHVLILHLSPLYGRTLTRRTLHERLV
jgi:hypothetical protein